MQHFHCNGHSHYALKITEDAHRYRQTQLHFLMQDLSILGLWYPWVWKKTAEDVLEHHHKAVFELILVSHSIEKAEDPDPAKITLKDVRNLRCFSVTGPSLSCCGGDGTKDGRGHLQKPQSAQGTLSMQ